MSFRRMLLGAVPRYPALSAQWRTSRAIVSWYTSATISRVIATASSTSMYATVSPARLTTTSPLNSRSVWGATWRRPETLQGTCVYAPYPRIPLFLLLVVVVVVWRGQTTKRRWPIWLSLSSRQPIQSSACALIKPASFVYVHLLTYRVHHSQVLVCSILKETINRTARISYMECCVQMC